jgi:hypothetical protein
MDETTWLTGHDPQAMLWFLGAKASPRKLRLFAVAAARHVEERRWLFDQRGFAAVAVAERFADGLATEHELETARGLAQGRLVLWPERAHRPGVREAAGTSARDAALTLCELALEVSGSKPGVLAFDHSALAARRLAAAEVLCRQLRDLFGNPFHPAAVDPLWAVRHDHAAAGLATAIYEQRAFAELPILADALEDAGCSDPVVLDHCRRPGLHVRGCWLLDRLLGKE